MPELDQKKLDKMKFYILKLEKENIGNRKHSHEKMVNLIRDIIRDEIIKTY